MSSARRDARSASLTQPGARSDQRCPECGSDRLTRIGMRLTDGTEVDFTSCHACEHRSWSRDGEVIELPDVLDRSRKNG